MQKIPDGVPFPSAASMIHSVRPAPAAVPDSDRPFATGVTKPKFATHEAPIPALWSWFVALTNETPSHDY